VIKDAITKRFAIPSFLEDNPDLIVFVSQLFLITYISAKCPLRLLRIISKEEKTKREFPLPSISLCNLENISTLIPVNFLV